MNWRYFNLVEMFILILNTHLHGIPCTSRLNGPRLTHNLIIEQYNVGEWHKVWYKGLLRVHFHVCRWRVGSKVKGFHVVSYACVQAIGTQEDHYDLECESEVKGHQTHALNRGAIWKGMVVLTGIYTFFMVERLVSMVTVRRRRTWKQVPGW